MALKFGVKTALVKVLSVYVSYKDDWFFSRIKFMTWYIDPSHPWRLNFENVFLKEMCFVSTAKNSALETEIKFQKQLFV